MENDAACTDIGSCMGVCIVMAVFFGMSMRIGVLMMRVEGKGFI